MLFSTPVLSMILSYAIVLVFAFTIHEFSHAAVATYYGDTTPQMNGRLTLNPLAHLDVIGSIMLLMVGFGWAKPVPVNPYALQRRSNAAMMLVSLAGPVSNLLMAILMTIPFRLGLIDLSRAVTDLQLADSHFLPTLPQVALVFVETNLLLALFNIIPLPPLDGEKVLAYFLPPAGQAVMDQIRPYGSMILILLVVVGAVNFVISPAMGFLLRLLLVA
jgi:Zn-dependent protease